MRRHAPLPQIEPLESRISPASVAAGTLVLGANTSVNNQLTFAASVSNAKTHQSLAFVNAADPSLSGADQAIAKTVGQSPEVFFIRITKNEVVEIATPVGYQQLVNVTGGNVVAFFTDPSSTSFSAFAAYKANPSSQITTYDVDATYLTGLALGNKVSVSVGDNINGDVVTNYNDLTGALGGASETPGNATTLLANSVTSLTVSGSIAGGFYAGANVSRFFANGEVSQILTGTAALNQTFSFVGSGVTEGNTTLTNGAVVSAPKVAGPSLFNVVVGSTNLIELGAGGMKGAGGSISGLTILNDTTGFTVKAGAGGQGAAGGSISSVVLNGPLATSPDTTPNSTIDIEAGAGGAGIGSGKAGAGGSVQGVFLDYNTAGTSQPSSTYILDNVTIKGGAGGAGNIGGAGGSLNNINVLTATPHVAKSTVPEYNLLGGAGGVGAGKGGAGGSVLNSQILDQALPTIDPYTELPDDGSANTPTLTLGLIEGGAGGAATVKGAGGVGGMISGLTLKGFNFDVISGAGGAGVGAGGAGGNINSLSVLGSSGNLPGDDYHVGSLVVSTGVGGNASAGKGGAGGSINVLSVENSDFGSTHLDLGSGNVMPFGFVVSTGNGGTAGKGAGGAGGSINGVRVMNLDFLTAIHPLGDTAEISITTGNGGDATGTGGAGGSATNVVYVGTRVALSQVTAGHGGRGGTGGATGEGGAGGTLKSFNLSGSEALYATPLVVVTPSPGELVDSSATFSSIDNVQVGDTVENINTGATATVTSVVSDTELMISDTIFAAGDSYQVIVPNAMSGSSSVYTGTAQDPNPGNDVLLSSYVNFYFGGQGAQAGDQIEDVTATIANGGTPVTTMVTGVFASTPNQLYVQNDIFHSGDQIAFLSYGTGTANAASYSNTTIIDPVSNFQTEGIQPGDVIEDLTQTDIQGSPVTAKVAPGGVLAHSLNLTVQNGSLWQQYSALGDEYQFTNVQAASITFTGGAGGAGSLKGAGGAGGGIVNSSANILSSIHFVGGAGGAGGASGAAGAGGTLGSDSALSSGGSGSLVAGPAGTAGAKPGAGGSINGADIQVLKNVTLIAGDGFAGGAGGNITGVGYSGVLNEGAGFNPPAGNVIFVAGDGGASLTASGGAGGSITKVSGFVSSGDGVNQINTEFFGGSGGDGFKHEGAGGSVSDLRFFGGGGADVNFFINAGDAGGITSGGTVKDGAAGGSVTQIGGGAFNSGTADPNFSINVQTDFHHISAGNGGPGTVKGGVGGSVSNVFVNAAIGYRSGYQFGFDIAGVDGATVTGAGGISAGLGGAGPTPGLAGDVTNIAADAIASIVAGRMHVGDALLKTNLANKVDGIVLNNTNAPSQVYQFNLIFDGETTVNLPTNATGLQVADALNQLPAIQAAGGVGVKAANGGYLVTFGKTGAQDPITASEPLVTPDGTSTELVQGVVQVGPAIKPTITGVAEVQSVPATLGPFTLSFNGNTTTTLPAGATAMQVQDALNNLATIQNAGSVTVAAGSTVNSYIVTFGANGPTTDAPQPLITSQYDPYTTELVQGNFATSEVQNFQVFGTLPYTLTFNGQTTSQLAANASASDIQTALNLLTSVQNAGGVTVMNGSINSASNLSFNVTFGNTGPEPFIVPNYSLTSSPNINITTPGVSGVQQVEAITLPSRGDLDPVVMATANTVGSIYDILQVNATTFHFNPLVAGNGFQFGDAPIDGLIAAVSLTGNKNISPEAFVTADNTGAAVLVDKIRS